MSSVPSNQPSLLRLAAPLVFSFWFRSAFQWIDTIYASSLGTLGDASIAAIGLTAPLEFLMIASWVGLSNGLTSRLAAAMGAHEGAKVEQLLKTARGLVSWLRILFLAFAVGLYFLVDFLPLDTDVARQFKIYGPVLIGGSALTSFWSIIPDSLVKAHNDTRSTMWAGMISTLLNFCLNTMFVFAFGWGIFGLAFATVLARLGGLAYARVRARYHENLRLKAGLDKVATTFKAPRRRLLELALPASVGFGLLALEGIAINGFITMREHSEATLAAWSIMDRAGRFLIMPVIAIGVAMLPLAARLWGAKNIAAIRQELRTALGTSLVYVLCIVAPVCWFFGPRLAVALTDSPEAQSIAATGLRWVFLLTLLGGPMLLLRSAFDGMQTPRPGLVVSLVRTFALLLPLSALGLHYGPQIGLDPILGLLIGCMIGAGVSSLWLGLWMRDFLGQVQATWSPPGS